MKDKTTDLEKEMLKVLKDVLKDYKIISKKDFEKMNKTVKNLNKELSSQEKTLIRLKNKLK